MTEPHPELDSDLVDLTGVDLADLADMEDSTLKDALTRLAQEAKSSDQTTASFSSSI
ncbi:FxSxx-COOH cyclophane-containing RiPP peptide [Cryptosporangium sp. NPDC048952]|uniref:FxSxx-COOH cyclophane-containing RiPP peptide n=1 Tax=Cryptosporangium sp. NPDC048952 TaxID=3363961 RepID=UPI00372089C8